jgi:predicted O-methyltransferase YrrM
VGLDTSISHRGRRTLRPSIVEIGVWKGSSVITLASKMKELNLDGVVIAVDTWLGA